MTRKSGDENMGRKKTAPPSRSVRIHEDVYKNAMIVAGFEEKDLTQFVSEILRPIVEDLLLKYAQKTVRAKGKQPPPTA
jgi:hypothetical protein